MPARGLVARFAAPRVSSAVLGSARAGKALRLRRSSRGLETLAGNVTCAHLVWLAGRASAATSLVLVAAPVQPQLRRGCTG